MEQQILKILMEQLIRQISSDVYPIADEGPTAMKVFVYLLMGAWRKEGAPSTADSH